MTCEEIYDDMLYYLNGLADEDMKEAIIAVEALRASLYELFKVKDREEALSFLMKSNEFIHKEIIGTSKKKKKKKKRSKNITSTQSAPKKEEIPQK